MKSILVFMWSNHSSCQILLKLEFSRQIFEKYWNTNRHENPSSGNLRSIEVSYGRTDRQIDERIYMTKLIVAFRNIANALKSNDKKVSREYRLDTLL